MFEKTRCINNIYSLAKERGVKIGDLEEGSGVSKGYLSRVAKPDYQGSPSIEMLDAIAHQLGVGIDFLVNYDPDSLSSNEQFVMRFIDKLSTQTETEKMEWLYETMGTLTADDNSKVDNPLVSVKKEFSDELNRWYDTHEYSSAIYEGYVTITGTCYHAKLSTSHAEVYLNHVMYHNTPRNEKLQNYAEDIIEVYLVDKTVQPICSTFYVSDELRNAVDNLYQMISSTPSKIALSQSTRSTMDFFIKWKNN